MCQAEKTGIPSFAKEGWLRQKENGPIPYWRRRGSCFKRPIIKIVRGESAVA